MKKEIIPTIFDSEGESFIRLEYFKDNELVKRVTIKVDKIDQEHLKEMFEDYYKKENA